MSAWSLQRNGADYAVFINTASEFDGSDSGARPDEAVSWGKIKKDASPVKVFRNSLCLKLFWERLCWSVYMFHRQKCWIYYDEILYCIKNYWVKSVLFCVSPI